MQLQVEVIRHPLCLLGRHEIRPLPRPRAPVGAAAHSCDRHTRRASVSTRLRAVCETDRVFGDARPGKRPTRWPLAPCFTRACPVRSRSGPCRMTTCSPQPRMSNAAWRGFIARHPGWRAPLRAVCSLSPAPIGIGATGASPASAALRSLRGAAAALAGAGAAIGTGAAAYTAGSWLAGPWSGGTGATDVPAGSWSGGLVSLGNQTLVQTHVGVTTVAAVPVPEPSAAALLLLPLAVLALCAVRRRRPRS